MRTLWLAISNTSLLVLAYFSQIVARAYHFSVDFNDGQMTFIYWTLFGVPPFTLATLASGVLERGKASKDHLGAAFWLTLLPAGISLVTWVVMFGVIQRIQQWALH